MRGRAGVLADGPLPLACFNSKGVPACTPARTTAEDANGVTEQSRQGSSRGSQKYTAVSALTVAMVCALHIVVIISHLIPKVAPILGHPQVSTTHD